MLMYLLFFMEEKLSLKLLFGCFFIGYSSRMRYISILDGPRTFENTQNLARIQALDFSKRVNRIIDIYRKSSWQLQSWNLDTADQWIV